MNKAEQILSLLSESTFWEDDQVRGFSMNMAGGISIGIDPKGSNWTLRITRSDGSSWVSPQAFPSVHSAKEVLRANWGVGVKLS